MAHFTASSLEYILSQVDTPPKKAVETGTWKGDTTELLTKYFSGVTTIELSESLHWRASQRFLHSNKVCCMLGDSAEILPKVSEEKPLFFYLDAHGGKAGGMIKYGEELAFPLWAELDYIATRSHADIVVVDDIASFGYHSQEPKWSDVSVGSCIDRLNRVYRAEVLRDQLVMYCREKPIR